MVVFIFPFLVTFILSFLSKKRDEKILEEIIKPKDELIQEFYQDNVLLYKELSKQAKVIEEAEKYQNEREKIFADEEEYKEKSFELEHKYHNKIHKLEKENNHLHKIIN